MRRPLILLTGFLFLVPVLLIAYRGIILGQSILPLVLGRIWQVTMEVQISPREKDVALEIALPSTQRNRRVIEEKIARGNMDLSLVSEGPNRFGVWSGPAIGDAEAISYRASVLVRRKRIKESPPTLEPYPPGIGKGDQLLAERLADPWLKLPPRDRLRLATQLVAGKPDRLTASDSDLREWATFREKKGPILTSLTLFRAAQLPSRPVEGLHLIEGVTEQLLRWVEVWNAKRWESVSPESGKIYKNPSELLPLVIGGYPPLMVKGAELTSFRWTLSRRIDDYWRLHYEHIRESKSFLDRWSLFHLPPEFQRTFRILILVPIGALLICLLRNIVGFPTFGIFMPILMALAFRNTGLGYGLAIFAGITGIGYFLRSKLDRLRLLLVPRLSFILTFVILCLTFAALLGNTFGFREAMAVGLLPIVILTMTIERFFIILEEQGLREGLRTALGTAAVSTITYLILQWELLQLTFFLYPELLFGIAGFQALIGRYTGFRLMEVFRFKEFRREP